MRSFIIYGIECKIKFLELPLSHNFINNFWIQTVNQISSKIERVTSKIW